MSRKITSWLLLGVLVATMSAALAAPLIRPAPAKANIQGIGCSLIPISPLKGACNSITCGHGGLPGIPNPVGIIGGLVGGVAGSVANAIFRPLLQLVANAEAGAVVGTLKSMANGVIHSTSPELTAKWFQTQYAIVLGMGVFLALGLFLTSLGESVASQDLAQGFTSLMILLAFLILGGTIPFVVGGLTKLCDQTIAPGMLNASGGTFQHTLSQLGNVDFTKHISLTNNIGTALLMPIFVMFVGVVMGVIVAFMDIFREAALYLATASMALTMAMAVSGRWGPDAVNRNLRVLIALVFFNVYYALIMTFGVNMFSVTHTGGDPVVMGTAIIVMGPILAFWTYRAISKHYPDTSRVSGALGSLSSGIKRVATSAA